MEIKLFHILQKKCLEHTRFVTSGHWTSSAAVQLLYLVTWPCVQPLRPRMAPSWLSLFWSLRCGVMCHIATGFMHYQYFPKCIFERCHVNPTMVLPLKLDKRKLSSTWRVVAFTVLPTIELIYPPIKITLIVLYNQNNEKWILCFFQTGEKGSKLYKVTQLHPQRSFMTHLAKP